MRFTAEVMRFYDYSLKFPFISVPWLWSSEALLVGVSEICFCASNTFPVYRYFANTVFLKCKNLSFCTLVGLVMSAFYYPYMSWIYFV